MAATTPLNLEVNTYFAMAGGLDLLMADIERQLETPGFEMKHSLKQAHTRLMRAARTFRTIYYQFIEMERIDAMKNVGGNYDLAWEDANELVRFILTYADRCDTPAKAARAQEWLHYLPQNLMTDDYLKEHFTLK